MGELAIDTFNIIVIATIFLVLALLLVGYWATHKPQPHPQPPARPKPENSEPAVSIGLTALGLAALVAIVIGLVVVIQNRRNRD